MKSERGVRDAYPSLVKVICCDKVKNPCCLFLPIKSDIIDK